MSPAQAMILSAAKGDLDNLQYRLSSGVSVDECSGPNGGSALHLAAFNGKTDCVRYLLDAGANVNIKAYKEETPLHLACAMGNMACISELLGVPGIDLNAVDSDGNTPIIYAYYNNHWGAVALLEAAGVDTSIFYPEMEFIEM